MGNLLTLAEPDTLDDLMTEILGPEIEVAKTGKCYAIIGTRSPDEAQITVARNLATAITLIGGHWVHTGAADGIDTEAMVGSRPDRLKVFLPWASYNRGSIPVGATVVVYDPSIHAEWTRSVSAYHPAASRLSRGAFALHARNFGIVESCAGVIALPGADGGGGTGQGIRIANGLGIPVVRGDKGSITDAPRFIGKALQTLGFASKDLMPIYRPSEFE